MKGVNQNCSRNTDLTGSTTLAGNPHHLSPRRHEGIQELCYRIALSPWLSRFVRILLMNLKQIGSARTRLVSLLQGDNI